MFNYQLTVYRVFIFFFLTQRRNRDGTGFTAAELHERFNSEFADQYILSIIPSNDKLTDVDSAFEWVEVKVLVGMASLSSRNSVQITVTIPM